MEKEVVLNMPVVPLRGKVIFPNVFTAFDVGRLLSLNAVNKAMETDRYIFVVSQVSPKMDNPLASDLYTVGTICKIVSITKTSGESFRVNVEGVRRSKVLAYSEEENKLFANVEDIETIVDDEVSAEAFLREAKEFFKENILPLAKTNKETLSAIYNMNDGDAFVNAASYNLHFKEEEKQTILEEEHLFKRIELFYNLMIKECEIVKAQKVIAEKVKNNVEKNQKEFYLREQLHAIHEELGDNEQENDVLEKAIKAKGLDKESEEKVLKELFRMTKMNPASPDYTVIRSYLDWILDVPFTECSNDTEDISECKKILEEDHFGLEKVKKRILEYIAVLKLTGNLKGSILCLVGPPGVGKTSVAKSVARALNRKLVRMSLGGVKDEAEIRGHRKTYIGAMPGRIIYGMKEAKTCNPVFLLDEIDKIGSDMRGDPSSALLEVLDPEQNSTFRDRYLEIPYDLSKVMFITTANSLDTIPAPLLDRMEVIDLSGYTLEEKVQIAKRYLIPKKLKECGLTDDNMSISDEGIRSIIEGYTGEAGVRKLEQSIGAVARKVATMVAENENTPKQKITEKNVEEYLGTKKHVNEEKLEKDEVGSATGLAWTAVGGVTLTIEVALMKGKGNLILTGKLGEVMQESVKTAIGYIHSNADKYGIEQSLFENNDIHVHVPEGATPKDGPSAGITMATAILSAFTGKKVRRNVAMTGEITLRGNVLAIGGLKEKSLAAYRLGVKKVVIPKANLKDLEEIPSEILDKITFIPVEKVDEVFKETVVGI